MLKDEILSTKLTYLLTKIIKKRTFYQQYIFNKTKNPPVKASFF